MTLSLSLGLLLLRLVCGLTLAAHGAQKLFGWFGGPGIAKQIAGFERDGLHPAIFWAALVVLGELGGGLSLAVGLLTPLGAAGIFAAMLMAILKVHWKNGFWNGKRGIEFPLSLLAGASALGLTGPGTIALDTLFRLQLFSPWLFLILAVAGVLIDILGLRLIRASAAPASVPAEPASAPPPAPAS
ncbi:MAG TPA: DoxX family protein [Ktedonobacteraceae bacterium]